VIVTAAFADFVLSAAEVAVTVTSGGLGNVAGAVYKPVEEIVPQDAPAQPVPLTLHVTLVFVAPVTVTVNCCLFPAATSIVVGEIFTATGGTIVTFAVANFVVSAADVTFTVTCAGVGTVVGAVYSPENDMTPHAEPVQPLPLTLQVTLLLLVPFSVARNRWLPPAGTVTVVGEIVIETGGTIVTDAMPDLVESTTDVAVTTTSAGLGTAAGAVYKPLLVIVPHAAPLQLPLKLHFTAVLLVFFTVAVNCCWAPVTTWTLAGETVTAIPGTIVTADVADLVGSATEVAFIETSAGLGIADGAV
jgi:hypothetical protein